jgi:hypothetical protein
LFAATRRPFPPPPSKKSKAQKRAAKLLLGRIGFPDERKDTNMLAIPQQHPANQVYVVDDEFDWRHRAALVIARRYALPVQTAAVVAELAGIGEVRR